MPFILVLLLTTFNLSMFILVCFGLCRRFLLVFRRSVLRLSSFMPVLISPNSFVVYCFLVERASFFNFNDFPFSNCIKSELRNKKINFRFFTKYFCVIEIIYCWISISFILEFNKGKSSWLAFGNFTRLIYEKWQKY